jgi:hypothetical protein
MQAGTAEVIRRFNQAFEEHTPAILEDLVLAFWRAIAADRPFYEVRNGQ